MAPAPIAQTAIVPVRYNLRIVELSPFNPNLPPLRGSHGRVKLHRLQVIIVKMLKDCGTLEHQLFLEDSECRLG